MGRNKRNLTKRPKPRLPTAESTALGTTQPEPDSSATGLVPPPTLRQIEPLPLPSTDTVSTPSARAGELAVAPSRDPAPPSSAQQPTIGAYPPLDIDGSEVHRFEAELALRHDRQLLVEEAVKLALEDRALLQEREVDAAEYEAEAKRWQRMLLVSTTPDSLVLYLNFYKSQWDLDSLITAGRVAQRALETHQRRVLIYQFAFAVIGVVVGYCSWRFDILSKSGTPDGLVKAGILALGSVVTMATAYGTKFDNDLSAKWQKCGESIVDLIRQHHERDFKEGVLRLSSPPRSRRPEART